MGVAPLWQGWLSLALLLTAGALSPLPSNAIAGLILGLAAVWLEGGALRLVGEQRFSPAVPAYLAIALIPGLGPMAAGLVMLVDAVYRMATGFWNQLGPRLPLALSLLVVAGLARAFPGEPAVLSVVGPLVYLIARFGLGGMRPPTEPGERLVWNQVRQRLRPLEMGLATMAPVIALSVSSHPLWALASLPLLACTHLAAENVLLTASDESIAEVLRKLQGAEAKAREAARQRDRALEEKTLLEGFSQQLASQPTLESTASSLVATTYRLIPCDNVIVFLGSPPEPFSYRVSARHQEALQGAALSALREPLVDRAFGQSKPALQKAAPEQGERLLAGDRVAAALPLGKVGILYVGRQDDQGFSSAQLERLKWLASKAQLALEAAFQVHEQARQRREQEQEVHRLERQVAWLSRLIQGAEAMGSSLRTEVLLERFRSVVSRTVPYGGAMLRLEGQALCAWGDPFSANADLWPAEPLPRPLVRTYGQGHLLVSPLSAGSENLGALALLSTQPFTAEQVDLVFLLCSQAAMALSHAALYDQVVEARRQLEESQASLVQSSKLTAIGQLAAGVAHELNSPMGAISLSVGEALHQLDDMPEVSRRLLGKAQLAVDRAKAIINRLLVYSRKPVDERQRLSLGSLVQETVEFLSFQLKTAGVDCHFQPAGEPVVVEGEEQPLQQVLTNLILNAAQAMEGVEPDRRRLRIALTAEKARARLEVIDQGVGIAEELRDRIFEPFFTTKPAGRGTGLGLWATRQIVTQHGGDLSVASEEGRGSTFTVSLPLAVAL